MFWETEAGDTTYSKVILLKGTVSRIFDPFWDQKNSTWAPSEQAKRFRQNFHSTTTTPTPSPRSRRLSCQGVRIVDDYADTVST